MNDKAELPKIPFRQLFAFFIFKTFDYCFWLPPKAFSVNDTPLIFYHNFTITTKSMIFTTKSFKITTKCPFFTTKHAKITTKQLHTANFPSELMGPIKHSSLENMTIPTRINMLKP